MIEPFQHNSWATLRLLKFCRDVDPAVLDQGVPGTYGSVKATLAHLISSEEQLASIVEGAPEAGVAQQPFTSLDDLEERARSLADRWQRALNPIPHRERLVETGLRGGRLMRIGAVLAQVIHHGNKHRAQVGTVLGSLGIQPPVVDGWTYGRWLDEQRSREGGNRG